MLHRTAVKHAEWQNSIEGDGEFQSASLDEFMRSHNRDVDEQISETDTTYDKALNHGRP